MNNTVTAMRHALSVVLLSLLSAFWATTPVLAEEGTRIPPEIRIGVLAKRGPELALQQWQATADFLQQHVPQHRFRIVPLGFDEIPPVVRNGLIDFLIVNPAIYVDLSVRYGIRRVLTLENRLTDDSTSSQFGSVLFTQVERSDIDSFDDLPGQRLAAVHETSLGGWIVARHQMLLAGVTPKDLRALHFSGTHDQVVHDVLAGSADVGAVRTDTLERMAREGLIEAGALKVIGDRGNHDFPLALSTELVPEWPLSQLSHVPTALTDEVAKALLGMPANSPAARAALIAGWSIPENYQVIHQILQRLALPPYHEQNDVPLAEAVREYWYWVALMLLILVLQSALIAHVHRLNGRLRRQGELILRRDEQMHTLFHQGGVGFAFVSPSGGIQQANRKLLELLDRSAVEVQKLNIADLVRAEDLSLATSCFEDMRRGALDTFSVQLRLRVEARRDPCWVLFTLSACRDEQGRIRFMVAVFDDIGDLKRLELQVQDQRRQKDLILNIAGDGILGLDEGGRHTFVNPTAARLLGYQVEQMLGRESHALWHHSHLDGRPYPGERCPITSVLKNGVVHRGSDDVFWTQDGKPLHVDYISTPIREGDRITGAVVVFRETSAALGE